MSGLNGVAERGVVGMESLGTGRGRSVRVKGPVVVRNPVRRARKARAGLSGARKLALGVGAVGTGLLALSVTHCTEAISLLTGAHWAAAGLMAIGIDAGMVVCEAAELAGRGKLAKGLNWAQVYVVAAVLLSVLLNAYAFGLHAADGMLWASWLLGAVIPGLVYCLGRVAGGLWLSE